ncbi:MULTISPECIES: hypothetical protein [unclassified Streptomyces]|uniref:hypothetical protein n=1 Tax=unclassified Streptomyces TaxID=2593676 RepID=UPI00037B7923|nr:MULTISPECIES: hypothetical protein [unclassified Streptomyces]MYT28636.1 hypothetical protein [Streptomyces sp. SID8354]
MKRLARIRMQVTGETFERALAVLRGDLTADDPGPEATSAEDGDRDSSPEPPVRRRPHLRGL